MQRKNCCVRELTPDLTPCDFFLWGFVKEAVYVRPLPTTLVHLKYRMTTAVYSVVQGIFLRVLDEFSYRLDVIPAAGG
jgi:sorbitol-specific phosphotransferase system component IIC